LVVVAVMLGVVVAWSIGYQAGQKSPSGALTCREGKDILSIDSTYELRPDGAKLSRTLRLGDCHTIDGMALEKAIAALNDNPFGEALAVPCKETTTTALTSVGSPIQKC
jgi:hypothetical protein